MSYSVEIRSIGENGAMIGSAIRREASSATEAFAVMEAVIQDARRSPQPIAVHVYDDDNRLIAFEANASRAPGELPR